jgi:hypothetical protein
LGSKSQCGGGKGFTPVEYNNADEAVEVLEKRKEVSPEFTMELGGEKFPVDIKRIIDMTTSAFVG